MAAPPMRYCASPGCPQRVASKYCEAHQKARWKKQDANRKGKEHRAFYNTPRWRRLREVIIATEPVCRECKRAWATEVDHIQPVSAGGSEWEASNLQALCKPCHSRKTMRELSGLA